MRLPILYVQKMNKTFYFMLSEHTSKEFSILSYIEQNSDATQRELSEHVGVSLGMINILMKRLVKKGLVKIERLQPNSVKYFLTPAGIANKLERTYGYIVRTYRELALFKGSISGVLNSLITDKNKDRVWFFGPDDDFVLVVQELLVSDFPELEERIITEEDQVNTLVKKEPNSILLTWNAESFSYLESLGVEPVHILSNVTVLDTKDIEG
jgi:DNA-binding MarR family transcriptional regulator